MRKTLGPSCPRVEMYCISGRDALYLASGCTISRGEPAGDSRAAGQELAFETRATGGMC